MQTVGEWKNNKNINEAVSPNGFQSVSQWKSTHPIISAPVITPQKSDLATQAENLVNNYAKASEKTVFTTGNAILHPIQTLKKLPGMFIKPFEAGIKKASTPIPQGNVITDTANLITGVAQSLFSPITGIFNIAENIPGAKQVADALSLPFSAIGMAASFGTGKIVDALPVSNETKAVIKKPLEGLASTVAEVFLGGKIMDKISLLSKSGADITPETVKPVIEEAVAEAKQQKPALFTKTAETAPLSVSEWKAQGKQTSTKVSPTMKPVVEQMPQNSKDYFKSVGLNLNDLTAKKITISPKQIFDNLSQDEQNTVISQTGQGPTITPVLYKDNGAYKIFDGGYSLADTRDSTKPSDFYIVSRTDGNPIDFYGTNAPVKTTETQSNNTTENTVVQIVNDKTGEKSFKTIPKEDLSKFIDKIDNTDHGIAGIIQSNGNDYHITAKTPKSMIDRGFKFKGTAKLSEIPTLDTTKLQDLTFKPTESVSKLAQSIKRKAIRDKMIYAFDKRFRDLPILEKRVKTEDMAKATEFTLNNPNEAFKIAMGDKRPPEGMLSSDVLVAVSDYASATKNTDVLAKLSNESGLLQQSRVMGQEIQALSQLNPVARELRVIKKARENRVMNYEKRKISIVKDIKKSVKEVALSKEQLKWDKFLNEVLC